MQASKQAANKQASSNKQASIYNNKGQSKQGARLVRCDLASTTTFGLPPTYALQARERMARSAHPGYVYLRYQLERRLE